MIISSPFHQTSLSPFRFMRFMERYAEDNGLGFAKKE